MVEAERQLDGETECYGGKMINLMKKAGEEVRWGGQGVILVENRATK